MNNEFIEVGKRITELRLSLEGQPNKEEFGKLVKIAGQTIGRVERGEIGLSRENLISICKSTDFSADYILFGRNLDLVKLIKSRLTSYSKEQIEVGLKIIEELLEVSKT